MRPLTVRRTRCTPNSTNVAQAARRGRGAALLLIALALALILVFIIPALNAAQAQNFVGEDDHPPYMLRAETVALVAPGELLAVNVSGLVDGDCHPRWVHTFEG